MVTWMRKLRPRHGVLLVVCTLAVWNLGMAAYIPLKAEVAQILLEAAWSRTQEGAIRQRPWRWADTWPVAKLRSIAHQRELIVLEGASGRNLAFGPAHISATVAPGEAGNSVIAGHRDTHFAWLEEVTLGEEIVVETPRQTLSYRVEEIRIVSENEVGIMADRGVPTLTLVTCYPFHAVNPGTDRRYVVTAVFTGEHGKIDGGTRSAISRRPSTSPEKANEGSPTFATLLKILHALGLRLTVTPAGHHGTPSLAGPIAQVMAGFAQGAANLVEMPSFMGIGA